MNNNIVQERVNRSSRMKRTMTTSMVAAAFLAVFAFELALFGSIDHPWSWFGLRDGSITRYLPSILMMFTFALLVVDGIALEVFRSRLVLAGLCFVLVEIIGSISYIQFGGGQIDESFLGRGINSITFLAGAGIALHPILRQWVSKYVLFMSIAIGIACLILLTAHSFGLILKQYDQVVRVQIVYLIAGVAWVAIRWQSIIFRLVVVGLMFLNGYLSGKSTNYLVGLMFAGVTFGRQIVGSIVPLYRLSGKKTKQALLMILIPVIFAFLSSILFLLYTVIAERATRYEFDVRRVGFELRWREFLDSPIFGSGFASSSNVADVFGFGSRVPSHNDVMDILSASGIVGMVVFLSIVGGAVFNRASREVFLGSARDLLPVHYFWLVVVFYIVGATGNPFFSEPYMAVPIWFSIGMMLGYRLDGTPFVPSSQVRAKQLDGSKNSGVC